MNFFTEGMQMKKKFLSLSIFVVSSFVSFNAYSLPDFIINLIAPRSYANCPFADPVNSPTFCASFKSVAACHCSGSLPQGMCQDMKVIYKRMTDIFGSQLKACVYQQNKPGGVPVQECMDDWNCYRLGGKASNGALCSNTGNACPSLS